MMLSMHQLFLLKHLAIGWKFKQINKVPGSWCTYWSLRRQNLIEADSFVTDLGRQVLAKELQRLSKRKKRNAKSKNQPNTPSPSASSRST